MTSRTVKSEELNVEDLIFTNFEDNMFVKSQKVAQIYYQEDGDLLNIQTLQSSTIQKRVARFTSFP